jgi:hypothetical protein
MRIPGLACALFALACGDIKTAGDGGPSDGGAPDARAVGSVTVTLGKLFGTTQPLAGNRVVFVDSAGAVAGDVMTDDGGAATADGIEAGSTMIIFIAAPPAGAPAGSQTLVVVGVAPGDDIHIDGEPAEGASLGNMNVSWPSRAGTSSYLVSVGCNSAGPTTDTVAAVTFYDACLADGEAQALVRAADGTDATVGWVGGTATFAADGTLDIAGPWTDPRALAVNLSGVPSEARSVFPRLTPWRGELPFNRVSLPEVQLTEATAAVEVPIPQTFASSDLVTLDFQPNQPGIGGNSLAVRVAADTSAVDLDLGDELLPWYGFPVLDTPSRTFHWTRTAGREPDAQYLLMFWDEKSGEQRMTVVMLPPDLLEVTMPELPADYEPFMPVSPAEVGVQVQAAEASDLDDYRAARQRGFDLIFETPRLGLEAPSTLRRSVGGEDF